MLKYLIIQLDDNATSMCHYQNPNIERNLISFNILSEAVTWSMKENLNVQFIYPDYKLPGEYLNVINSIDHADIVSSECSDLELREYAEVVVFNSWKNAESYDYKKSQSYVVRTIFTELFQHADTLSRLLTSAQRVNVVILDIEKLDEQGKERYSSFLSQLTDSVKNIIVNGNYVNSNIITDRLILESMNNCNAGDECITLAPDGNFYICPAFYYDNEGNEGSVVAGLSIKNPQLFKLSHAPICQKCDAWHCKRCVWLNKKLTLEVNTPSSQQCVTSHLERNSSRNLLEQLTSVDNRFANKKICELDYLDPFCLINK